MAIQDGYDLLKAILVETTIFDLTWIVSLILTFLTLIIITRNKSEWKKLAFPVLIGWHVCGIKPHILLYIITSIMFVIEHLSLTGLSTILKLTKHKLQDTERLVTQNEARKILRKTKKQEVSKFQASRGELGILSKKEIDDIRKMGLGK